VVSGQSATGSAEEASGSGTPSAAVSAAGVARATVRVFSAGGAGLIGGLLVALIVARARGFSLGRGLM
jgi:hypothetical protein